MYSLSFFKSTYAIRPFGYKRVYLPLRKVADTPFHIQGDELYCLHTYPTAEKHRL